LCDEPLKDYLLHLQQERSLTNNTIRVAVQGGEHIPLQSRLVDAPLSDKILKVRRRTL